MSTTASSGRTLARPGLKPLVLAVREVTARVCPAADTAESVGEVLRANLPPTELLSPEELAGDPDRYQQHVLHAEPDGAFSIVALVWLPGQETPIHDHVSWCVVGVIDGYEHEVVYDLVERDRRACLVESRVQENHPGSVCAFSPPGDIHLVRNAGDTTAVSLHVYGADIDRLGSSIRRRYDLPVLPAA